MADIDLVPRHRSAAWIWWLIAAIVIILLIAWAVSGNRHATSPATELQPVTPHAPMARVTEMPRALQA